VSHVIDLVKETFATLRGRIMMETELIRIAEIARTNPSLRFTSLYHYLNREMLLQCHNELDGKKAKGIDGISKSEYEQNLLGNIDNLVERLKTHSYKPKPVKRVYIPKGTGNEKRPLGIGCYEDKIVELALSKILQAVFEPNFLEFSYGFRFKTGCHDAIRGLNNIIGREKCSYVVDADIKGFFCNADHEWITKFLEHRIVDPNIIRLVVRFLKAGIMEDCIIKVEEFGMPQGSGISPILSNIYLHYVLDLWFEKIVMKQSRGQASIVRFVDDFVCCFQYKDDAEKFYTSLKLRLQKFKLEIAENKTKIIEFGRFAESNRKRRKMGKPETFDFLGFTHYCSKSKSGKFRVKRKTSNKKFKAKIKDFSMWIKRNRHKSISEIFNIVAAKLRGHYRYYGITDNSTMIEKYRVEVIKLIFKWLNRRSQRRSFTSDKFNNYLKHNILPRPKIYVNIYSCVQLRFC
jgi:group II intron reverse transcriptase/maturase